MGKIAGLAGVANGGTNIIPSIFKPLARGNSMSHLLKVRVAFPFIIILLVLSIPVAG